jgi:hypothetical protein
MEEYDWSPYLYIKFIRHIPGYHEGTYSEYEVRWIHDDSLYMTSKGQRMWLVGLLNRNWKKIVDDHADKIILGG